LWAAQRTPGPRLEPGPTTSLVALDELVHPPAGNPVVPGHLRLRPALLLDRRNHQPPQRHVPPPEFEVCTMSRDRGELCRETRHCRGHGFLSCFASSWTLRRHAGGTIVCRASSSWSRGPASVPHR